MFFTLLLRCVSKKARISEKMCFNKVNVTLPKPRTNGDTTNAMTESKLKVSATNMRLSSATAVLVLVNRRYSLVIIRVPSRDMKLLASLNVLKVAGFQFKGGL